MTLLYCRHLYKFCTRHGTPVTNGWRL